MITRDETIVDLDISSFKEHPLDIAKILGIQPSRIRLEGELVYSNALIRHKENGLEISSSLSRSHPFMEHIDSLSKILIPLKDKFKNLPSTCEIMLSCHIYIYEEGMPAICLDVNMVKLLSDLNAEIDIDLYYLGGLENPIRCAD